MKLTKQFTILLLCIFFGCELGSKVDGGFSDAELVQMIIEANKVEVSIIKLPEASKTTINAEIEYDEMGILEASGLGYEVKLAGNGYRSGHRKEVFFNIDGRKLNPYDWGGKREENQWNTDNNSEWKCFEMVFPVTFEMPDGSNIVVQNDDEDGWAEIRTWYESNPNADEKPLMSFPVLIFLDEESVTVNDRDELKNAYSECRDGRREDFERDRKRNRRCFKLVYPISFIMPDGSLIMVENDDENGWDELKTWYEENSGFEDSKPAMEYPVDILYESEDGDSTVTLHSEEEMEAARDQCREEWDKGFDRDCFDLVFPLTYLMPDGSLITVENDEGYMSLRNWYEENQDENYEDTKPELQYPVDIVIETEDGETVLTLNNEEEMASAKEECWRDWTDEEGGEEDEELGDDDCFTLILPITYIMPDGTLIVIEAEEDYRSLDLWYYENEGTETEPQLQYPVDVAYETEDGETNSTINNESELESLLEFCQE